jgi:RNA polymerase sigma factor (sigma-70 family)
VSTTTHRDWLLSTLESQHRLIHKVCWAYTRTPEDRDDLFQEIAVRLLSAARNYDPTRKLSTWVYRVALNVAIDFHRQRLRRRKVLLGFEGDGQSTSEHDRAADEQLRELRELLERLTEVDRALLLLHLDGNSYREIGEVIGISETNVGTRLSRLKRTLRESAATIGHWNQEHCHGT